MKKMNMVLKKTSELSGHDKRSLIALKQRYWIYSDNEQNRWFDENVMADDNHLLIYQGKVLLAYLNAVNVEVRINQFLHRMLGIGNVCVEEGNTHAGIGSILMAHINSFIKMEQTSGILLCKAGLVEFYSASNWKAAEASCVLINEQSYSHVVMIYDPYKTIDIEHVDTMDISRNF